MTETGISESIQIVKGQVDPALVSVYCIVKDELFYLRAFLDHYRKLGIRQFIFLDDRSTDGTFEYLEAQADCVLAKSSLRYGDKVGGRRAVHIWKSEIPRRFLFGNWAVCVDADEFLFTPPQFPTFDDLLGALEGRGITAVAAVMVDFYPDTLESMRKPRLPQDRAEMFAAYPWFDAGPYLAVKDPARQPDLVHGGVRERLLKKFDVSQRAQFKTGWSAIKYALRTRVRGKQYISPASITKVPLAKWQGDREYMNSHVMNESTRWDRFLPLAHFKFTPVLHEKIGSAAESLSYSNGSRAYFEYAELLERMERTDPSFLADLSVRFTSVEDFAGADLMRFD